MVQFENLIRILATVMGGFTLFASTVSAIVLSRQKRGLSSGTGAVFRGGLGVLIMTIGLVAIGILLWKPVPFRNSEWVLFSITIFGAVFYSCGTGLYFGV